jgi:hypothetical protein
MTTVELLPCPFLRVEQRAVVIALVGGGGRTYSARLCCRASKFGYAFLLQASKLGVGRGL